MATLWGFESLPRHQRYANREQQSTDCCFSLYRVRVFPVSRDRSASDRTHQELPKGLARKRYVRVHQFLKPARTLNNTGFQSRQFLGVVRQPMRYPRKLQLKSRDGLLPLVNFVQMQQKQASDDTSRFSKRLGAYSISRCAGRCVGAAWVLPQITLFNL